MNKEYYLPSELYNYLKGNEKSPHLKIMAILGIKDELKKDGLKREWKEKWGVFFSCRPETGPKGDSDYKGEINDKKEKPIWKSQRSIWIVPLNEHTNKDFDPNKLIQFEEICFLNEKSKTDKFNGFSFEDDNKNGLSLFINSHLKLNSKYGEWKKFSSKGEKEWNIWFVNSEVFQNSKILSFDAPKSQIVDSDGFIPEFEFSIGIRIGDGRVKKPFFTIENINLTKENYGKDCQIVWQPSKRVDDVLVLENRDSSVFDTLINLTFKSNIRIDEGRTIELINTINTKDKAKDIQCNFIKIDNSISLIYAKSFNDFYEPSFGNPYFVIIQVFHESSVELFTRISNIYPLLKDAYDSIKNLKKGLDVVRRAEPFGIVPEMEKFATGSPYVSCWKLNSSNLFDLKETKFTKIRDENTYEIELPNFYISQNDLSRKINLKGIKFETSSRKEEVNDNGTFSRFHISDIDFVKSDLNNKKILDGSLEFTLEGGINEKKVPSWGNFKFKIQNNLTQKPFYFWDWPNKYKKEELVFLHDVDDFYLPVKNVSPANIDYSKNEFYQSSNSIGGIIEGMGEKQTPPLIISLGDINANSEQNSKNRINYLLEINESTNLGQNHRVVFQLIDSNIIYKENEKVDRIIEAIILDSEPQFVGKVQARFLQESNKGQDKIILAKKSKIGSIDGGWEILDDKASTEGFNIILPSQAIGEAIVKSAKSEGNQQEPQENKPIDYRFGSNGILNLSFNRNLDKNYVSPPWDLRKLWGTAGDEAPGVKLLKTQFELFYGLYAQLYTKEAGIAEMGSKIGDVIFTGKNSNSKIFTDEEKDAFKNVYIQHEKFYRAFKQRLAILELSNGNNYFEPSFFDKDLKISPRVEVKIEDGKKIKKGASFKAPVNLEINNNDKDIKLIDYHNPEGLAGGAFYGFESKPVYEELWRDALKESSSSASIRNLAFSSLGGYGNQIARFAGDKSIISSFTSQGRTHNFTLERIGRISVLWHKAKHVIEYSREVVPSKFYSGEQPDLLGRTIVRKVREYIEILEEEKTFPDFSDHDPISSGCVLGTTFKSKIIDIRSSWGKTVFFNGSNNKEAIGWEVPLWKEYCNQSLYPKPQVAVKLLLSSTDSVKEGFQYTNIAEPQNIYFYTFTREFVNTYYDGLVKIDANTKKWPSFEFLDYTNLELPSEKYLDPCIDNTTGEGMDLIMPDIFDVPPGFERFTFRLESSENPIGVANRYDPKSKVAGKLRTVTLMRKPALVKEVKNAGTLVLDNINGNPDSLINNLLNGTLIKNVVYEGLKAEKIAENIFLKINGLLSALPNKQDVTLKYFGYLIKPTLKLDPVPNPLPPNPILNTFPCELLWNETLQAADGLVFRVLMDYDKVSKEFQSEVKAALDKGAIYLEENINVLITKFKDRVSQLHLIAEFGKEHFLVLNKTLSEYISSIAGHFQTVKDTTFIQIADKLKEIENDPNIVSVKDKIDKIIEELGKEKNQKYLTQIIDFIDKNKGSIPANFKAPLLKIKSISVELLDFFNKLDPNQQPNLLVLFTKIRAEIKKLDDDIQTEFGEFRKELNTSKDGIFKEVDDILKVLKEELKELETILSKEADKFVVEVLKLYSDFKTEFSTRLENELILIRTKIQLLLVNKIGNILFSYDTITGELKDSIYKIVYYLDKKTQSLFDSFAGSAFPKVQSYIAKVNALVDTNAVKEWLDTYSEFKELDAAIQSGNRQQIIEKALTFTNKINKEFGKLATEVVEIAKELDTVAINYDNFEYETKQVLENMRMVVEEFNSSGLGLNRKTCALIMNFNTQDIEQRMNMSPAIAKFQQLGQSVEQVIGQEYALKIRNAVTHVFDGIIGPKKEWGQKYASSFIEKFKLNNILPNFSKMDFGGLFPKTNCLDGFRDKIKFDSGFDKVKLTAWAKASVDFEYTSKESIMDFGPLKVEVAKAKFNAWHHTLGEESNGNVTYNNTNYAVFSGDWEVTIGGTQLMTFENAQIIIKDGVSSFKMGETKMNGLMKMLTDASSKLSSSNNEPTETGETDEKSDSLFKISTLKYKYEGEDIPENLRDLEVPIGVRAAIDLPVINIGGGTTSMTNLTFGAHFLLKFFDENDKKFNFLTGIGFYLSSKKNPFIFTAFIFGGGGYVNLDIVYDQKKGIEVDFVMSVLGSAGFAIAAGWINGSVMLMIGFEGQYIKKANKPEILNIAIYVQLIGNVNILGLADVYLGVLLQAQYEDQRKIVGTGRINVTVRVCRFYSQSISRDYTKVLN